MTSSLRTYSIYNEADQFIVQGCTVLSGAVYPDGEHLRCPTLEIARDHVPPNLIRFAPSEGDDPRLVETWL